MILMIPNIWPVVSLLDLYVEYKNILMNSNINKYNKSQETLSTSDTSWIVRCLDCLKATAISVIQSSSIWPN